MSAITYARTFQHAPLTNEIANPRFEMWLGGAILATFLFGSVGWASMAHLDAAIHSPAVVRVAGNRQTVQSSANGVVARIAVKEGQRVVAGQVLIDLTSTEASAQNDALASHVYALQAEIARIAAENSEISKVSMPTAWAALTEDDRALAMGALANEQSNLDAQRALLASQRAVLQQRIVQIGDQIGGYRQRQSANMQQMQLNKDELDQTQALFSKGYAPKTRVLALQRSAASITGEMGATAGEMARLQSQSGETRLQSLQLADERKRQNTDRLRQAETELQTALPQWRAAREQLERTRVRAPVAGSVIGLSVNTIGAVIGAGQKLLDIVPTVGDLVVEARVSQSDANDLKQGQSAKVQISGMRGRVLAPLAGTVTRVSADALTDEKTGQPYFSATVAVPRAELDRVSREAGIDGLVKPGTPVEMIITLRRRTALQYWLEPLLDRFSGALSEG